MKEYTEYRCDGEICNPLYMVEDAHVPVTHEMHFCKVDQSGVLPEGWLYYPKEKKFRCPRCVKHKEKD